MPELERWVLHRLSELDATVRSGYAAFDYNRVFTAVFNFCTTDLSAIYFDIRKDTLYCDAPSSPPPRRTNAPRPLVQQPDGVARPRHGVHDGRSLAHAEQRRVRQRPPAHVPRSSPPTGRTKRSQKNGAGCAICAAWSPARSNSPAATRRSARRWRPRRWSTCRTRRSSTRCSTSTSPRSASPRTRW